MEKTEKTTMRSTTTRTRRNPPRKKETACLVSEAEANPFGPAHRHHLIPPTSRVFVAVRRRFHLSPVFPRARRLMGDKETAPPRKRQKVAPTAATGAASTNGKAHGEKNGVETNGEGEEDDDPEGEGEEEPEDDEDDVGDEAPTKSTVKATTVLAAAGDEDAEAAAAGGDDED